MPKSTEESGLDNNGNQNKEVDMVETTVENLKEKLALNGFQEAVVRNLTKDNQAKSKVIIETTSLSNIEKRAQLEELGEKFNTEVKKILSPEQIKKYDKLIAKNKR